MMQNAPGIGQFEQKKELFGITSSTYSEEQAGFCGLRLVWVWYDPGGNMWEPGSILWPLYWSLFAGILKPGRRYIGDEEVPASVWNVTIKPMERHDVIPRKLVVKTSVCGRCIQLARKPQFQNIITSLIQRVPNKKVAISATRLRK